MLSIYKPAENAPVAAQKRLICLKQKDWSKKGGGYRLSQPGALITSADNSWPPPLPFHTVLKIPQQNIFTMYQLASLTHSHRQTHTHTHTRALTYWLIHSHIHTHKHTKTHAHRDMYKKREYVRLRNIWSCMERYRLWSGIVCWGDQGTWLR